MQCLYSWNASSTFRDGHGESKSTEPLLPSPDSPVTPSPSLDISSIPPPPPPKSYMDKPEQVPLNPARLTTPSRLSSAEPGICTNGIQSIQSVNRGTTLVCQDILPPLPPQCLVNGAGRGSVIRLQDSSKPLHPSSEISV